MHDENSPAVKTIKAIEVEEATVTERMRVGDAELE
jgi:hypothetical protein